MNNTKDIPSTWELQTLETSSEIILGQSPPSSTYNDKGDGLPFYQGKTEFGDIFPKPSKWCNKPKKIALSGDVLISVRAPVGPTNLCQEESCIGRGLAAIRPKPGIITKYILYYLRSNEALLAGQGTGTTFKAITGSQLRGFPIPVPPVDIQERLVTKIEALFTQMDVGVAELREAKARLKHYRQSVLKAAVTGELTRDWREAHQDELEPAEKLLERILTERRRKCEEEEWRNRVEKAQKKVAQKERKEAGLPYYIRDLKAEDWEHIREEKYKQYLPKDGKWKIKLKNPFTHEYILSSFPQNYWCSVSIDSVAFVTKLAGFEYTKYVKYSGTDEIPVIRGLNVSERGFKPGNHVYVTKELVENLPRSRLYGGEILLVFVGSLGNVGIVPKNRVYFLGPNVALIRVESSCLINKYLMIFLRSVFGKDSIQKLSKATTQGSISMSNIRSILFPIPSKSEQERIITKVGRKLSVADEIEKELDLALQNVERLRQSILKQAFEGKLLN